MVIYSIKSYLSLSLPRVYMKVLFVHAKSKADILPILKKVKISGRIGLVSNIQHLHKLEEAKKFLGEKAIVGGQILGCDVSSALRIKDKVDSYLYIGTGKFHPIGVALKTGKPVYIANPLTNEFSKVEEEQIEQMRKETKGKYLKFLYAKKVGILLSIKPGQFHPKQYLDLNKKLDIAERIRKKYKKETYIFVFNTLNYNELNNFPDIECWINTACPRIEYKNIIYVGDINLQENEHKA